MYSNLYGLETIVLRYFNVYGDRAPKQGQYAPVLAIFNRQKDAGEPITIIGDGTQRRDFIHVDDVASAFLIILRNLLSNVELEYEYSIGSGSSISLKFFSEIVLEITNSITRIEYGALSYRKGELMYSQGDITQLNKLGWEVKISLKEGLLRYLK